MRTNVRVLQLEPAVTISRILAQDPSLACDKTESELASLAAARREIVEPSDM
jgi:hypothetical protein